MQSWYRRAQSSTPIIWSWNRPTVTGCTQVPLRPMNLRLPFSIRSGVAVSSSCPRLQSGVRSRCCIASIGLKSDGRIPKNLPVYLNSPMAVDVTELYQRFASEHRLTRAECDAMCHAATFVNSVEQSKHLNSLRQPMIIIAASGMATGGRVIHHLKTFASDPRNMILFSGYQAAGTRGAAMLSGAKEIRIHGQDIPVRAEIAALSTLSAHADSAQTLQWLRNFKAPPRITFITHGEPVAADALRQQIERKLRWATLVPEHAQSVELRD